MPEKSRVAIYGRRFLFCVLMTASLTVLLLLHQMFGIPGLAGQADFTHKLDADAPDAGSGCRRIEGEIAHMESVTRRLGATFISHHLTIRTSPDSREAGQPETVVLSVGNPVAPLFSVGNQVEFMVSPARPGYLPVATRLGKIERDSVRYVVWVSYSDGVAGWSDKHDCKRGRQNGIP